MDVQDHAEALGTSSQPDDDHVGILIDVTHLRNLMTSFLIQKRVRKTKQHQVYQIISRNYSGMYM